MRMSDQKTNKPEMAASEDGATARQALRWRIAEIAYEKYIQRGQAPGHDMEDWLEAERAVLEEPSNPSIGVTTARPTRRPRHGVRTTRGRQPSPED
jgi:DUF2934 family protein